MRVLKVTSFKANATALSDFSLTRSPNLPLSLDCFLVSSLTATKHSHRPGPSAIRTSDTQSLWPAPGLC